MNTRRLSMVVAGLCLLVLALPLGAQEYEEAAKQEKQEEAQPDMAAMMEAWTEAGTPGEPHQKLARMAGDWDVAVTMYTMGPEPTTMEAEAHSEMILGGRFLRETFQGDFMGQPFTGWNLTGYDNVTGRYQAVWVDNMSTGIYHYTGSMEGNTLTTTAEFQDPMSGDQVTSKNVIEMVSDDEIRMTAYEDRGSGWTKSMEITYTRKQM